MKKWIKTGLFILVCGGCVGCSEILEFLFFETKILDTIILHTTNFEETDKEYYYDSNKKHCLTYMLYTGDFEGNRRGIYIMPYKFEGFLPDSNYIRLSYIGAIENLYFKWQDDTLYIRTMDYGIIDNKLPSTVVLDREIMDYERWGRYHDTTRVMDQYLEWKKMKAEYSVIKRYR